MTEISSEGLTFSNETYAFLDQSQKLPAVGRICEFGVHFVSSKKPTFTWDTL